MTSSILEIKTKTDEAREFIIQSHPSIVGTGITHSSYTGINTYTNEHQILIYLKDETGLEAVPSEINGIKVVYKIIGEVRANVTCNPSGNRCNCQKDDSVNPDRVRPIIGGASISPAKYNGIDPRPGYWSCSFGTLGGFPSLPDGTRVGLTNNHVIALDEPWHKGPMRVGDNIIQPGAFHNGDLVNDVVGKLSKWDKIPSSGNNEVDYAYFTPTISFDYRYNLCNYAINYSVDPVVGMKVKKTGARTGCTSSVIESIDVSTDINYSEDANQTANAHFIHQFTTTSSQRLGNKGDSGSIVVTDDGNNNAVGLYFADSENGTGFANYITIVERKAGVSFGTRPTQPPTTQPPTTQPPTTQPPGRLSINITNCPESLNSGDRWDAYFNITGGTSPYIIYTWWDYNLYNQSDNVTCTSCYITMYAPQTEGYHDFVITMRDSSGNQAQSNTCSIYVYAATTQPTQPTQPTGCITPEHKMVVI